MSAQHTPQLDQVFGVVLAFLIGMAGAAWLFIWWSSPNA